MRHHNTVLHDVLKFIPWSRFDRLVDRHEADARVRQLSTKSQFIALLHAQLAGLESLREIEGTMASHAACLYHVGAKAPKRSTLSDANRERPAAVFAELFGDMVQRVTKRKLRRDAGDAINLIDATNLRLSALSDEWARYEAHGASAKMHVVFDAASNVPVHFEVTPARTNDITAAKGFAINPGETYVFDLGYYDFGWWRRLHDADCRFVTRLKKNTRPNVIEGRAGPTTETITIDRIVCFTGRVKGKRRHPLHGIELREIEVIIATGKTLRLLTNDLDAPGEEIARLYKTRWQIELFFRWVKQNLKIKRFLGTSENAIRIQITVALIAYLLLHLAHASQNAIPKIRLFVQLVRANLMHRRRLDQLREPPPRQIKYPTQAELPI